MNIHSKWWLYWNINREIQWPHAICFMCLLGKCDLSLVAFSSLLILCILQLICNESHLCRFSFIWNSLYHMMKLKMSINKSNNTTKKPTTTKYETWLHHLRTWWKKEKHADDLLAKLQTNCAIIQRREISCHKYVYYMHLNIDGFCKVSFMIVLVVHE